MNWTLQNLLSWALYYSQDALIWENIKIEQWYENFTLEKIIFFSWIVLLFIWFFYARYLYKFIKLIFKTLNNLNISLNTLHTNQTNSSNVVVKTNNMVSEIFINSKNDSEDLLKSLISFTVEIWKMSKKIQKIKEQVDENTIKWFEFSIEKSFSMLDKHGIKIIDYTNQKYIEWMNWIEIVSVEKDENIAYDIVFETLEPGIELYGNLIKQSKVIILSK